MVDEFIQVGRKISVKNKFFTREFVPAAQISQVERMAWLLVWIFLSLRNETGIYAAHYYLV